MNRRLSLSILTIVLALAGCDFPSAPADMPIGSRVDAVLGGTVAEPGEDPAVVALANSFGPFCTGTLVTPRAVLTAAHCIDQFDPSNPQLGIFFGSDIDDGARGSVLGGEVGPGWTGQVGFDNAFDMGILLLKQSQDPALPLPMNTRTPMTGESYRHVGFGVFDNALPSDGRKRKGTVTISDVGQGLIESGTAELSICFGDSGGPGFIETDGVEFVAGVHSFTSTSNGGCRAPAGDGRVDVALEWITPFLDENDPSCGPDGICSEGGCSNDPDCASCGADGVCVVCAVEDPDCPGKSTGDACQQGEECEGGVCVVWDGDFTSEFCSENCSGDGDCPSGMECRNFSSEKLCYWEGSPPGQLGGSCDGPADCFSNMCDDSECVIKCNIGLGFDCPADFKCEGNGSGEFFCRGEIDTGGGGGCNAGSDTRSDVLLLLLGLAAYFRRRRKVA